VSAMKRWNPFRWIQNVGLSELVTTHGMQQELEAIADRRGWEPSGCASPHRAA